MPVSFLKKGTKVKITKIIAFTDSQIHVGSVMNGTLEKDVELNSEVSFARGGNTSPILSAKPTAGGDLILVTDTSIYFASLVTS